MIDRYTRKEMGQVWDLNNRFEKMKEVELAVAGVQAGLGIIPRSAYTKIKAGAKFKIERILELEKTTKHDVIAFVTNMAENVGEAGKFIHYGLTSSDVLDTASSLQVMEAADVLNGSLDRLEKALSAQAKKHQITVCAGRTHGMHAEPTSFGLKLAGHLAELKRNRERFDFAVEDMQIGKLSGAVGSYSALSQEVEEKVCKKLGLEPETIATQVIPRDRHAFLLQTIALIGAGIERLAVELRHLQRTEVDEVIESFSKGQKGSSAMPHKKNPISAENLTGCARLLRSYAHATVENVALWHERDISHSSVERVVFPDAFILCDYAVDRMARVVQNLKVQPKQMKRNMDLSQGQLYSSHILLALIKKGKTREEAYAMVQKVSHGLKPGQSLKRGMLTDREVKELLTKKEMEQIFSGVADQKRFKSVVQRVFRKN